MKKTLFAVILFVFSSSAYASDVCDFATADFVNAVKVYKKDGVSAYLKRLLGDGPLASEANYNDITPELERIETFFGVINGASILSERALGPRACYVFGMLEYENGPAYALVNYYKASNGYVLTAFRFQTEAEKVLPNELLIQ